MIENSFYSYVPTDWFDGSIQWIPTSFEWTSGPGTLWDGVLWLLKRSLDARCGSQTPPPSPFPLSSHFPMIIEAQTSMYPGEAAPLHSLVAGSMCGGRDSFFCTWNWCKSKVHLIHLINIDSSAKSWIAMWPSTLMGLWPRLLVGLMAHRSSAMWRLWDGEIGWDWFCCDRLSWCRDRGKGTKSTFHRLICNSSHNAYKVSGFGVWSHSQYSSRHFTLSPSPKTLQAFDPRMKSWMPLEHMTATWSWRVSGWDFFGGGKGFRLCFPDKGGRFIVGVVFCCSTGTVANIAWEVSPWLIWQHGQLVFESWGSTLLCLSSCF